MHGVLDRSFAESQTFQAHDKLALGLSGGRRVLQSIDWRDKSALSAKDLDAFSDVTLTERANLRAKKMLWLLEAHDKRLIDCVYCHFFGGSYRSFVIVS